MPTPIIVCGAAGRMGRALINLISQTPGARLAAAIEAAGNPTLGQDAGTVAGAGSLGVTIGDDYAAGAAPDNVTLDFTNAEVAIEHLRSAVAKKSAIVIGSTGYNAPQLAELDALAVQTRSVIASNMSVGITVLQKLMCAAARALGDGFDPEIVEMHHKMKIDAPSGTAVQLGRALAEATGRDFNADAVYGRQGVIGKRQKKEIGILALRGGDVVGDHTVIFAGTGERIELTHRAQSRDCLASGAMRAALWVVDKPSGRYSMADVLGI